MGQNSLMLHVKGTHYPGSFDSPSVPFDKLRVLCATLRNDRDKRIVDIISVTTVFLRSAPGLERLHPWKTSHSEAEVRLLFIPLKNFFCEAEESAPAGLEVRGIVSPLAAAE